MTTTHAYPTLTGPLTTGAGRLQRGRGQPKLAPGAAPLHQNSRRRLVRRTPQPLPPWAQAAIVVFALLNCFQGTLWNAATYDISSGQRGHLVSESYAPSSGTTATLAYTFDGGSSGGLGQRTSSALTGSLTGANKGADSN